MFGKGVYFADQFEKSLNYCYDYYGSNGENDTQVMLMSEVACGKMYDAVQSEPIEQLKKGFQSLKGLGSRAPDYDKVITMMNGVEMPVGKVVDYELSPNKVYQKKAHDN